MKRKLLSNTYAAAVALFIALFSVSLATRAENYDLEVAGIRVTSQNCNNIAGDPQNFSENSFGRIRPQAGGYVKYVPHSKTLYIKDTQIVGIGETGFSNAIKSAIEGLTIFVEGDNSISSQTEGDLGVVLNKKCTFTGGGTLEVTMWNEADFRLSAPVTIQNCTIIADKTQSAFYGGSGSSLTVRGAKMVVKGEMSGFDLILRGSKLITPSGVSWNAEKKAMCNAAGRMVYDVVITIERDVESYGLDIADIPINSANFDMISEFRGVAGKVSYDPSTKTLTLDNANIKANESNGIISSVQGLKILVKGQCDVGGDGQETSAMYFYKDATITGNGKLTADGDYDCISVENSTLTIENCTLRASSTGSGMQGIGNSSLVIKNADVSAQSTAQDISIKGFSSLTTIGCEIITPKGGKFDSSKKAVCDAQGESYRSLVEIAPKKYPLSLADVVVTEYNCNDLSVIPGVKGTVKYDPATKTLYLKDAEIITDSEDADGIFSEIEDLTIKVEGNCTIKAAYSGEYDDCEGIAASGSLSIKGNGTLNINSETYGIYIYKNKKVNIEQCRVSVKGGYGISGGENCTLGITNAIVTVEGDKSSVSNIYNFTLEGCKIATPAGAVFNAEKRALCDASGNIIKSKVVIAPTVKYGLYINDVEVDELNCNDLSVIPGVKGTVKYAPSTKTLTLNNAEIISGEDTDDAISTSVENLRIRLEGTNTLRASDDGIETTKSMTVFGSGTLNIESGYGIYLSGSLTVENGTINIKATNYGIYCNEEYLDNNKLTVKNATLTIENSEDGAICQLSALTLDGCKIAEPAGAVFNAEKHALCDADGNIIKSKVVIRNTLTAIDGIGIGNQHHRSGIYTLDGRRLDTPFRHLPKGIYVVDGRKVVKH